MLVHQLFEITFKQIVFELRSIRELLQRVITQQANEHRDPDVASYDLRLIAERLTRCEKLMRLSIPYFEVLETMHPQAFLEFRPFLGNGSGFQSLQSREIECLMGLERPPTDFAEQQRQFGRNQQAIREHWDDALKDSSISVLLKKWLSNIVVAEPWKTTWWKIKQSELIREKAIHSHPLYLFNIFNKRNFYRCNFVTI